MAWDSDDVITDPEFLHTELIVEQRIKSELHPPIKLDSDTSICRAHLTPEGCSLGSQCPLRHTTPASTNFIVPFIPPTAHGRTVCKHWLRGLCKKAAECDFLHEYNLRKMPECWFFTKHGFCSSGDECMYLHITPHHRRPECRSYTAGFCRLGPDCPNKHIRRVLCPLYLVGFCPDGLKCKLAHPPFTLPLVERALALSHSQLRASYKNRGDREWPDPSAPSYGGGQNRYDGGGYNNRDNNGPMGGGGGPRNMHDQSFGGGMQQVSGDVVLDDRPPMRRGRMKHVTCFKCGQEGHLANICTNPSVPGNRGGVERGPGGRPMAGM